MCGMANNGDPNLTFMIRCPFDTILAKKPFLAVPQYTGSVHKLQGDFGSTSRCATKIIFSFPASTGQKAKNLK